jgi:hypothetical protein
MIQRLYPGGKTKAFNISYDDGVVQDIRFAEMLNRYGLKGTFNLNYGLMRSGFTWQHECGMTVRRIPEDQVAAVYEGHEIASHSYSHPYFDNATETEILKELGSDKFFLEKLLDREVAGYATPFYYYSDLMADSVRHCGFAYARISEESGDYSVPEDFYRWRGSKFHWDSDLEDFVAGFLETDQELALCQLVGHSYDLDVLSLWETMERICRWVSENCDVRPMTNIELVRYLRNMRCAQITDREIINESCAELWFAVDGKTVKLLPGECLTLI